MGALVVGRGHRLAKAAAMGFETVNTAAGDPVGAVRGMTGRLGADVAIECAGVPETIEWSLEMLRRGGRCAAVGIPTVGVEIAMVSTGPERGQAIWCDESRFANLIASK